jgi:N6-adenosine-specific RNA methylase IME4
VTKTEGGAPRAAAEHVDAGAGSDISQSPLFYLDLDTISGAEFNRDPGDLKSLKRSIEENGLITPLACTPDGKLLAGRRRFAVLKQLGWRKAPFLVITPEDETHAFRIMLDENVERKPLTDPEYASQIKQFEDLMREKHGSAPHGGDRSEQILAANTWSQDKTAEALGVSQPTISQAIKIATLIEEHPEWAHLKGKQILRKAKIEQQIEELEGWSINPPDEYYDVIVVDPPWPMAEGAEYDPDYFHAGLPYPHMSIEEIMALPIPAADDCVLWLWTINRLLHDAFHVLERWGFEYKVLLTWRKPHIGVGSWLRGQTEHCLLGIRGRVPWACTDQPTVIDGPIREHSRKPDEFYELVDSLCHGRKLDMFSREKRDGWDQWGDEVDKF